MIAVLNGIDKRFGHRYTDIHPHRLAHLKLFSDLIGEPFSLYHRILAAAVSLLYISFQDL
jgi:hypothetical protein